MASESFTLTVLAQNDPPVLAPIIDANIDEDTFYEVELSATDPDSEDLIFSAGIDGNANAYVEGTLLSVYPDENFHGDIIVSVVVSDGFLEDSQEFTLIVNSINDPPVLESTSNQTIDEDHTYSQLIIVEDPDTENLNISGGVDGNSTFSISENILLITPDENWYGDILVNLSVSDGEFIDQDDFVITVIPVNDAPIIDIIEDQSIFEDSTFEYELSVNDVDGDEIVFTAFVDGNATPIVNGDSLFVYPDENYFGDILVTIYADDEQERDMASESFTLTVLAQNDPPVLDTIENQSIDEDTVLNQVFSAFDEEDDPLEFSVNILDGNAIAEVEENMAIFTPSLDWNGLVEIEVIVNDGLSSDTTYFTLTVIPVNDYPIFTLSEYDITVNEDDSELVNNVTIVDYIPSDEINQEVHYSLTPDESDLLDIEFNQATGECNISLIPNANGAEMFTITADDGQDENNMYSQEFMLTIYSVNDAPELISFELANGLTSVQEDSLSVELEVSYFDIDSDPILNELPFDLNELNWSYFSDHETALTLNSGGIFTIDSLKSNWNGIDNILVIVNDGRSLSDSIIFELTVDALNDPISILDVSFENNLTSIPEDTSFVSFNILLEDVDSNPQLNQQSEDPLDNFNLTWNIDDTDVTYVSILDSLVNNENGNLTQYYMLDSLLQNWNGHDTLNILVQDGTYSDSIQFPIHVTGVNDAPEIDTIYFENDISFIYEDTSDVGFVIDIYDVDSDISLNFDGDNPLDNMDSFVWSINESEYIHLSEVGIINGENSLLNMNFEIDSLLSDWNGYDTIQFALEDGIFSDTIDFPIFVEQVNDYLILDSVYFEGHISWIPEDTSNVLFHVEYRDVDMNSLLNYAPDSNAETVVWGISNTEQIQTDALESISISNDIALKNYSITTLLANWNGHDTLNILVQDGTYSDSIQFPIHVTGVNDAPEIDTIYFENDISFIYEDTSDVGFVIDIYDVDSDISLNFDGDNPLDNMDSFVWSINESEYIHLSEVGIINGENSLLNMNFEIDSLLSDWNGYDTIQFALEDGIFSDTIDFPIFVEQVNDYLILDSVYFEGHISWIPEDTSNVLFHVEYRDVDMNSLLNYAPDSNAETVVWGISNTEQIQTDALESISISNDIALKNYSITTLLENWNGHDELNILVQDGTYSDSIQFSIHIKQRNDSLIQSFEVIPDFISYNPDPTTFYSDTLENTKLFYRYPKDIDNNSILESLPLQFKWSRDELLDIDTDTFLNNDTLLSLYYRLELSSDDTNFIVVKDSIEDKKFSGKDSVTVNIDLLHEFLGYKDDYYIPDNSNGSVYLDTLGTTEYSWRVTAMNYWRDDLENDPEYISVSDTLNFYIDLKEPIIDYAILQNEVYSEYYDVYMLTTEEVIADSTDLIIVDENDGVNNQEFNLNAPLETNIYSITTSFPSAGLFTYNFDGWDHARNNFNSTQKFGFQYIAPSELSRYSSPSGFAIIELISHANENQPILIYESEIDLSLSRSNSTQVSPTVSILYKNTESMSDAKVEFDLTVFLNEDIPYWQYQIMQFIDGEWSDIESQYSGNILSANIDSFGDFSVWVNTDLLEPLPEEFSIFPSYPNPFNPSLTIPYSLPHDGNVEIMAYNILGQHVASILDGFQTAGYKQIIWNTEATPHLSSGVYFVQIKFDNVHLTQKVMFLK